MFRRLSEDRQAVIPGLQRSVAAGCFERIEFGTVETQIFFPARQPGSSRWAQFQGVEENCAGSGSGRKIDGDTGQPQIPVNFLVMIAVPASAGAVFGDAEGENRPPLRIHGCVQGVKLKCFPFPVGQPQSDPPDPGAFFRKNPNFGDPFADRRKRIGRDFEFGVAGCLFLPGQFQPRRFSGNRRRQFQNLFPLLSAVQDQIVRPVEDKAVRKRERGKAHGNQGCGKFHRRGPHFSAIASLTS